MMSSQWEKHDVVRRINEELRSEGGPGMPAATLVELMRLDDRVLDDLLGALRSLTAAAADAKAKAALGLVRKVP